MSAPQKLNLVSELKGHEDRVWCVAWHPTEKYVLATCSGDKTVKLWAGTSVDSLKCLRTLDGEHHRAIRTVAWSPSGEQLACSSFDATVSVWRRTSPDFEMIVESILEGHENEVKSVAWDNTGKFLSTCSRDKSVWVWEAITIGDEDNATTEFECAAVLCGHSQDVKCVRWHPQQRALFSCGYDDTIKVWEESPKRKDDWHCTETLIGHTSTVWQIAFQPEAEEPLLASCADDNAIILWQRDEDGWKQIAKLSGYHERTIFAVDWASPTHFASCSADDSICVYRLVADRSVDGPVAELEWKESHAHNGDVNCVRFCPSMPSIVASCADDNTVRIWSLDAVAPTA